MASTFNELNSLHIKRPALITIKKPFATDAEMEDELRGLLFKYVPQEKESVSRIVGTGKIKAVYFTCHLPGTPYIIDDYTNVPFFSAEKLSYGVNADRYFASSSTSYFEVVTSEAADGDMKFSDIDKAKNNKLFQTYRTNNRSVSGSFIDDTDIFRDYYCFIFDDAYTIPEQNQKTPSKDAFLDTAVIEFTELIEHNSNGLTRADFKKFGTDSFDSFIDTKVGQRLLKYNKVYSIYHIRVQKGVGPMKFLTKKEVQGIAGDVLKSYSNQLGPVKYGINEATVTNQVQKLRATYNSVLNDPIKSTDNTLYLNNFLLPEGKDKKVNYLIPPEYHASKSYVTSNKYSSSENPNVSEFLLNISLVNTKDNPTFSWSIRRESKDAVAVSGAFVVSSADSVGAKEIAPSVGDIISAYEFFCKDYINSNLGTVDYETAAYFMKYCCPIRPRGDNTKHIYYEKIREMDVSKPITNVGGIYFARKDTIRPIICPGSYLTYLARSFSVSSVETTRKETSLVNVTKNWKVIPTICDFKFEFYCNVFKKYIHPRYIRISALKNVTVTQVYSTFIQDALGFKLNTSNPSSVSNVEKARAINLCERVLFNTYSGFYITNETTINETVSKYVNTEVREDNLTDGFKEILKNLELPTDNVTNIANRDVSSIVISRQVMGKSTFQISIKNNKRKYNIETSSSIFGGESVFEPMDEVYAYLPDKDGLLQLAFKGYISDVENVIDNGYNSIKLSGECPLKRLEMVRTNVKPSLGKKENRDSVIHPYIVPESFFGSFEKWGLFMLAQGLSFFHSCLSSVVSMEKIYTLKNNQPVFFDDLLTYLWYKHSIAYPDQQVAASALSKLLNKYVYSSTLSQGDRLSKAKEEPGILDLSNLWSKSDTKNKLNVKSVSYRIYAQRSDSLIGEVYPYNKSLVAEVSGTRQPAFVLQAEQVRIAFSNYRTNLQILLETAEKFNFFFYSSREGIVKFTPPQIGLTNLSLEDGILKENLMIKHNDLSYKVSPTIIGNQTTASYNTSASDRNLINWMTLQGEMVGGNKDVFNVVVENRPLAIKYGIKSQKDIVIPGVTNVDALYIMGVALMDRNNKSFRSAKSVSIGYGDMDINETVFCPVDNTVYLREGLILDYRPGVSFTASSSLNWGRKPLYPVGISGFPQNRNITPKLFTKQEDQSVLEVEDYDATFKEELNYLLIALNDLFKADLITVSYYNQVKTIINYVLDAPYDRKHLLSSFIFNGYFWDGVSSVSFEDLLKIAYDSRLDSVVGGIVLSFALNPKEGKFELTKTTEDMVKAIKEERETYEVNRTGSFPATIFVTSNSEIKRIWASKTQI